LTRNGHFGCQFAVWFGAVSDGLVRRQFGLMARTVAVGRTADISRHWR
jgi:hypothetical protein